VNIIMVAKDWEIGGIGQLFNGYGSSVAIDEWVLELCCTEKYL
jgi:hypothetical protein